MEENLSSARAPEQQEDTRPVLLITTVDIGGGRSDKIELRQGDSALDAARAFCQLHNIPASVVGPLADHIIDNLRKANLVKSPATSTADGTDSVVAKMQRCLDGDDATSKEQIGGAAPHPPQPAAVAAASGQPSSSSSVAQKLTFADGMNDRLYKQLSAKLMPLEESHGGGRLLSVGASLGHVPVGGVMAQPLSGRAHHSRASSTSAANSDRGHRKSQSAEGSPRVHSRLYQQALDLRHKHEARRRQAAQDMELTRRAQQQRTSMSWISQEMMRDRSSGPFTCYGEMLYAEGLEQAAQRRAKAAAVRAERAARELDGATFMPEITRLAAALWAGDDLDAQPAWQRLSANKRSKALERIREMKAMREQQELKECTFHPRVNRNSAAMMADRTAAQQALNLSTHEQLFADAVRRQHKMEALQSWLPDEVTFMPAINKGHVAEAALHRSFEALGISSRGTTPPLGAASDLSVDGSHEPLGARCSPVHVVDRLYLSMEKTKAKLEEKRAQLHGSVDPSTGHLMFQPEVGRGPRGQGVVTAQRNREGLPIGEYLYVQGLEAQRQRDAQLQAEKAADKAATARTHSTTVSQKLFDKLRAKRFGQIFEYLDTEASGLLDLVGLVRAPTAHMDNLDNEVREDVESAAAIHAQSHGVPLLGEPSSAPSSVPSSLGGEDAVASRLPPAPPVDLSLFSALMDEALRQRRKPRGYLVPSPSTKYVPSHSFHPAINKRSRDLASRLRPAELATHEVLHHNAEALRCKLEAARREAQANALEGCTFAPKLNPALPGSAAPVEGKALRAARAAIAAGGGARQNHHLQQQQQQAQGVAAPAPFQGSTRSPPAASSAAPAPAPRAEPHSVALFSAFGNGASSSSNGGATQQQQLAALEAQVQEVLQGVSQAHARLHALEEVAASPDGQQGVEQAGHVLVQDHQREAEEEEEEQEEEVDAHVAMAVMGGAGAAASDVDLRATEALLLDMLTSSPGSLDTAADTDVINQLHRVLVVSDTKHRDLAPSQQQQQQQRRQHIQQAVVPTSLQAQQQRSSKAGSNAVNLFVVPADQQPRAGRL